MYVVPSVPQTGSDTSGQYWEHLGVVAPGVGPSVGAARGRVSGT